MLHNPAAPGRFLYTCATIPISAGRSILPSASAAYTGRLHSLLIVISQKPAVIFRNRIRGTVIFYNDDLVIIIRGLFQYRTHAPA